MIENPGRRFDAPGRDSPPTIHALRDHWKVLVALIVNVSVLQTIAFGLVAVDTIASDRIAASIASVSIFVVAETDASAADVDALGPLIRAVPGVATASLRPKDDAIRSLIAGGLPAPDGRNPLPDVWVVRLQPGTVGDGKSVAPAWTEKRLALVALPRVASVSTDERWVATIDRGIANWRTWWPPAMSIGLGGLALAALGAAYLAGCALRVDSPLFEQRSSHEMRALALIALSVVVTSTLIGYTACWAGIGRSIDAWPGGDTWPYGQLISTQPVIAGGSIVATMLIVTTALAVARRVRK